MEPPAAHAREHSLQFSRRPAAQVDPADRSIFGRIAYGIDEGLSGRGVAAPGSPDPAVARARVPAARLLGRASQEDVWTIGAREREARAATSRTHGRTGCVRWVREGGWLFGVIEWTAADEIGGLLPLAERSYRDLFATLAECGTPALQRVWNYLPRINEPGLERERYQEFNIGRQRAFMAAGQSAFVGAPAACALGTAADGLTIFFLAGLEPTVAIENPRQIPAYRYPDRYGPSSPTFSRAALAELEPQQLTLFISGTASIVGHESLHTDDTEAQVAEIVRNLEALIGQANARSSARFTLGACSPIVYVREPAEATRIERALSGLLGAGAPFLERAIFLQADICRQELRVEIEAVAQAPGRILPA